jgi:hypothetical protein
MPIVIKCRSVEEARTALGIQQIFVHLKHYDVETSPETFAKALSASNQITEQFTASGPFYAVYRGKTHRAIYVGSL